MAQSSRMEQQFKEKHCVYFGKLIIWFFCKAGSAL
jgi:hypothetical protein